MCTENKSKILEHFADMCRVCHLSVACSGVFEATTQAVNSVDDQLPGEVVLHRSAHRRREGVCAALSHVCHDEMKLSLTWYCVWRGPRSSSEGKGGCTPPPPPLAGHQGTHWTTRLE